MGAINFYQYYRTAKKYFLEKNVILRFIIGFFLVGLAGCAATYPNKLDKLQHGKLSSSDECEYLRQADNALMEADNIESAMPNNAWECSQQFHKNGDEKNSFTLSFLEFNGEGDLRNEEQLRDVLELVSSGQHFVIVYVHGWRHDAGKDDNDVRKFRTSLAYSRQFLNQRCIERKRFCDHKVTGIYVAWPGRGRFDCKYKICNITVAPSLIGRKKVSDGLGDKVVNTLIEIDDNLKSNEIHLNRFSSNRMLVTGHSLGGNILAAGLKKRYVTAVSKHEPKQLIQSELGDLVVLFNPASEANNWTEIQEATRDRMDFKRPHHRHNIQSHSFYSSLQPPIYISLTSACSYPSFVRNDDDLKDRKIICDAATGKLFPIFHTVTGKGGKIEKSAIGQFEPSNACVDYDDDSKTCKTDGKPVFNVGTTHEFDINSNPKKDFDRRTIFRNSFVPSKSECDITDGWLNAAKLREKNINNNPHAMKWDAGYRFTFDESRANYEKEKNISPISLANDINGQFRHSIYRGKRNYHITSANDPFWNVRALDTAVIDHGGFSSYPTWCALNQLVLDDITSLAP